SAARGASSWNVVPYARCYSYNIMCIKITENSGDNTARCSDALESEPRDQCARPWREIHQRRGGRSSRRTQSIDAAETSGGIAVRHICSSCFVVVAVRITHDRSIKDVGELDSNFQT